MSRQIDKATLDGAAEFLAAQFLQPDLPSPSGSGRFIGGPSLVMQDMYNFTYADEFAYVLDNIKGFMGPATLARFEAFAEDTFEPRDEELFHKLLADRLAVDPDGEHIPGMIGTTQVDGRRVVGFRVDHNGRVRQAYWNIYAGEMEERLADSGAVDPIPDGAPGMPVGALNTRIANIIAIKACDIIVDELDTGTVDGLIEGRTGVQPADPDTAVTGVLLFSLDLGTPAFGAAIDAAPGGEATANAIADDTSADATGTLGYCRASSANVALTPLDDLIDGEAGTSGADFNFNTLSIVSGSTVSMTSWTVTMPEA